MDSRPLLSEGRLPVEGLEYASLIGAARLLVLAALSGGACVWDLRVRRIPNALTFPAAKGRARFITVGQAVKPASSITRLLV